MITKYTAGMKELVLEHKNVKAIVGNLLCDPPEPVSLAGDEYHNFDLITVGAALHHFPSAAQAIERLATRLRPGGVIYIQDFLEEHDHKTNDIQSGKRPRGYSLDGMRSFMDAAGLVDFGFDVFPNEMSVELMSEEVLKIRCFAARAMKPNKDLDV
jgi:SAM-dependent methyltransferase